MPNIYQKLIYGAYKVKLENPQKPTQGMNCPQCKAEISVFTEDGERVTVSPKFCSGCGYDLKTLYSTYETQLSDYEARISEFKKEEDRLFELFKEEALADLGLSNHPKAEILFSRAKELSPNLDFGDIYIQLKDIAEVVKILKE